MHNICSTSCAVCKLLQEYRQKERLVVKSKKCCGGLEKMEEERVMANQKKELEDVNIQYTM